MCVRIRLILIKKNTNIRFDKCRCFSVTHTFFSLIFVQYNTLCSNQCNFFKIFLFCFIFCAYRFTTRVACHESKSIVYILDTLDHFTWKPISSVSSLFWIYTNKLYYCLFKITLLFCFYFYAYTVWTQSEILRDVCKKVMF